MIQLKHTLSEHEECEASHVEPLFAVMDDTLAAEIRLREQERVLSLADFWGEWGCSHCHYHIEKMGGELTDCWLMRRNIEEHLKNS